MTDPSAPLGPAQLSAEEARLVGDVAALVDAIIALDEEDAYRRADELAAELSDDEASDLALHLIDWYIEEPEEDVPNLERIRALFLAVLVRLGNLLNAPEYAYALVEAASEWISEDPAAAEALATRAIAITDDEDTAAQAHAWLAFALGATGRTAQALEAARRADETAAAEPTRLLARGALLELLADVEDPEATPLAIEALAWCSQDPLDSTLTPLAQAALRALVTETSRCERDDRRPTAAVANALYSALKHPAWTPDFMTRSDFATLVAWVDFLRDDLTRLEEVLAVSARGTFTDAGVAAHAAVLGLLVPYVRGDHDELERRLHQVAPLVTAANDPRLSNVFRAIADSVTAPLRGGSFGTSVAGMAGSGRGLALLGRSFDAIGAFSSRGVPIPAELDSELETECGGQLAHEDPVLDAGLSILAGIVSGLRGDWTRMQARVRRARTLYRALPATAPQLPWLRLLFEGLCAAEAMLTDAEGAVAQLTSNHLANRASGRGLAAFVTASQLLVIHLSGGRNREAFAFGVEALAHLERHRAQLAGSSERHALRIQQERVYGATIRAAAALRDPELFAELLEYLRAQDLPVVLDSPDPAQIPMAALLAGVTGLGPLGEPDPDETVDAVQLSRPRPVLMPWGRTALASWGAPTGPQPVPLVVPRLRGV